ncbi:hypothetical protein ACI4AF_29130, partial [Klebsiella pneumoniae]|uniref:hypothetical protein n=1 Tax=Klebsiella pneumoniae TaxID=573 RepID=UPI0038550E31
ILRHIADESGYFMHPAPKTRPLSELDYDDLESQIQYIAREYCEKLTEWVGNEFGPWGDEKAQADMIEEYRSYRSHVISWLRLGVRRAR